MHRVRIALAATLAVAALASTGIAPADAAPPMVPQAAAVAGQSGVVQVRDGVRWRRGWYNGYRGYPRYRPGYSYYDGWWYPGGAFVAGALIGGAIAYSGAYYGPGYYPRYDEPRYYEPRYYEPERIYYPPGSNYRAGYRDGYRDGYYARRYGNPISCTARLQDAGKC
ncbi:BA14K family protein [Mesorhizobium marinum]|uniref:BA14K family protein n=1 Tax=Mesorhizobium marinum TaxID=3228790 RepID=A0ABV3QW88_9HYPH